MGNAMKTIKEDVFGVPYRLTERIRIGNESVRLKGERLVEAMISVGELLIEARGLVEHGRWGKYSENVLGFHPKTIATYVRFATYAQELRTAQPNTIHEARLVLSHLGVPATNNPVVLKRKAMELRAGGLTYRAVAAELGVSHGCVSNWINRDRIKKQRAVAHSKKRKAEVAALNAENTRVARLAGDRILKAYEGVRVALNALDAEGGMSRTTTLERTRFSEITSLLHRAEDRIMEVAKQRRME